MNLYTLKNKKGFTIIEVILVLAVAGLIFLMVFLALPALQRAQRDTQRKQDMAIVRAAINTYKSNNGGSLSKLRNFRPIGKDAPKVTEGPLAPYLSEISSLTKYYRVADFGNSAKEVSPGNTQGGGIVISSEQDHNIIYIGFDIECSEGKINGDGRYGPSTIGKIAIFGSLESIKGANDSRFGSLNYCETL